MSLSALNSPPLLAALGSGAWVLFPMLEGMSFPLATLKYANVVSFCINVASVSVPGRIDGQQQAEALDDDNGRSEMAQLSPGKTGRTLLAPSGWAFSIWGPIFMGEFVLVIGQLFVRPYGSIVPFLQSASIPFIAANAFQSLWCAAFRPKYKGKWMGLSFACLASTAFWLSKVHNSVLALSGWNYLVYGFPMSLHFGWVTAASLVNLNGAVAMSPTVSAKTVAWVGHASVVAATILGLVVTVGRRAPVYGGVICWALTAVADGMAKRIAATKDDTDPNKVGVLGAKLQFRLSRIGAFLTGAVSLGVAVFSVLDQKNSGGHRVAP